MRRFVLSLAAVLSVGLSACSNSGGGSVLGFGGDNPSPDHVIITVAAPSNIARVLPGAGLPLSATQVHGSQNGLLSGNNYRWSAELVTSGTYTINALGQTKPCVPITTTTGGVTTPYTADFGIYIAIDPVNEANIIFFPPTLIPLPAGATTISRVFPYCVIVNAQPGKITGSGLGTTFTPTGPPGSITVAVVDPQNPLF
jgi:hypothetical protein